MLPDPRGRRAQRLRELLIAAAELWRASTLSGSWEDANLAISTIESASRAELFGIVREDLARYVHEQFGEAAAGFWAHLRKYGGEAALPASPSAGGPR